MSTSPGESPTGRIRIAAFVVLMSFLFGNNFVALDVGLRDAGPITLQAFAVTWAALAVWMLTPTERFPVRTMTGQTRAAVVAVAFSLSVASPLLMAYGVQRVNPAVSAMLVTTAPIVTLLLERVVFARSLVGRSMTGVALGIAGVGLVVSPLGDGGVSQVIGILSLFGASTAWAVGLILTRRMPGVFGGGRFVLWQMLAGLPVLYVLAIVVERLAVDWSWSFVLAAAYSGVFAKGMASFIQFRVVRQSSPLQSSLSAFLVPAVATVSSYVILGDRVAPVQIAGMLVIGLGVAAVVSTGRWQGAVEPPP